MTKAMTQSVRRFVKTACKSENYEKITKTRLIRSLTAHKALTRINTKKPPCEDRVTYIYRMKSVYPFCYTYMEE